MDFIDLFAGIGGFHLGLEQANNESRRTTLSKNGLQSNGNKSDNKGGTWGCGKNIGKYLSEQSCKGKNTSNQSTDENFTGRNRPIFDCVWANEWDKYAGKVYQARFPKTPFSSIDLRLVKADDIPEADLLCAGFPCQPFSLAGKRKGFDDTRGTLFFEIARILEKKRTMFLLLENVKGLLSHDDGKTMQTIIRVLNELGYIIDYRILNSKDLGVPQNRERIFIWGINLIKAIQESIKDGVLKRTRLLEEIMESFLLEVLLKNFGELKKEQEIELKGLDLNLLLWKGMQENFGNNQKLKRFLTHQESLQIWQENLKEAQFQYAKNEENLELKLKEKLNMWIQMDTKKSMMEKDISDFFTELLLNNIMDESNNTNQSIISILTNSIMNQRIFSCAEIKVIMVWCIIQDRLFWENWLKEKLLVLTKAKGCMFYAESEGLLNDDKFFMGNREDRQKFFLIGHIREKRFKQIFPIGESGKVFGEKPKQEIVCPAITARYYKRGKTDPYIQENELIELTQNQAEAQRVFSINGIARTIKDGGGQGAKTGLYMVNLHQKRTGKYGDGTKQLTESSFTLDSGSGHDLCITNNMKIRRLTPTECERLQGFPDGWTMVEGISETQRYKMLGNAVTVNVVEAIGRKILEARLV